MRTTLATLCLLCLSGPAVAQEHLWQQRQQSRAFVGQAAMAAGAAGFRVIPYHQGGSVEDGFWATPAADTRDTRQLFLSVATDGTPWSRQAPPYRDWVGLFLVTACHAPTEAAFHLPTDAVESTRLYALFGRPAAMPAFKAAVKLP